MFSRILRIRTSKGCLHKYLLGTSLGMVPAPGASTSSTSALVALLVLLCFLVRWA